MWLSVIQLWHFLFIGTLNSLLTNLASGDTVLGRWWGREAAHPRSPAGDLESPGVCVLSSAGLGGRAPKEGLRGNVGRRVAWGTGRVGGAGWESPLL